MSRRGGGGGGARGKRLPGAEFSWQSEPGAEADTAPTPLFPVRFTHFLFCGTSLTIGPPARNTKYLAQNPFHQ